MNFIPPQRMAKTTRKVMTSDATSFAAWRRRKLGGREDAVEGEEWSPDAEVTCHVRIAREGTVEAPLSVPSPERGKGGVGQRLQ
jgi:hypothetical protein